MFECKSDILAELVSAAKVFYAVGAVLGFVLGRYCAAVRAVESRGSREAVS